MVQQVKDTWTPDPVPASAPVAVEEDTWVPDNSPVVAKAAPKPVPTPKAKPVGPSPFQDRDLYGELQQKYPGIGLTSGYRDKEYQRKMKERGYKPAANSEHLVGDSIDIKSFPGGLTLAQGAAQLRKQYPEAKIIYGDKNHKDHVHFSAPGYGAFPALGGAADAGLSNPSYAQAEDGWTPFPAANAAEPAEPSESETEEGETVSQSPAGVTMVGGLPKGSEIEFNVDKNTNQIFDRDKWLMEEKGFTSDAEEEYVAWLNANRGNKNIEAADVAEVFNRLAPSNPQPEEGHEKQAELLREGKLVFGPFDSKPAEEEYRAKLQEIIDKKETGSQGDYAALTAQGLMWNMSDEAEGLLAGAGAALQGEDPSEAYDQARNVERLKLEQARENKGGLGTAAEVAASIPTAFALPFANAKKVADLAKAGAASGAAYGFGRGSGLGDSLGSAAIDAATGAIAAPAIDKVVKKIATPIASKIGNKIDDVEDIVDETIPIIEQPATPVEKLQNALAEAKPLRDAQDKLTKEARKERAAKLKGIQSADKGESGFFKSLAALKGELPKIEAQSIRNQFSQDDLNTLYAAIHDVEGLGPYDVLNAQKALTKLLGPEGVGVPTESEAELLSKIFPEDLIKNIGKLRPAKGKLREAAANALNLPRAVMSTMDLSAPLRQGVFTIRRKEFWKNFKTMFKAFGSEDAYKTVMNDIDSRPSRALMDEYGLAVTGLDGPLAKREEDFMSNWAEKIPVFGKGARASNRAYTAFLAKLRADVFDDLVSKMSKIDPDYIENDEAMKSLAGYVNNATGRGSLGGHEGAAPLLNAAFFSPRLISARVQLLNPVYYYNLPKPLRVEALKDLAAFGSVVTTVLSLAKASGAEVETDPRSSNFAKIKVGDTRYDILGGFQQYLKLAAVLATNTSKTGKGEEKELGEEYRGDTRLSTLGEFARSKLSPVVSYLYDALEGKDFLGEPFDPVEGAAERFVPMFLGDMVEAFKEEGLKGAAKTAPGFFGVGVSTYPTPKDFFGNVVEPSGTDDPVYKEVESLGKQSEIIGTPSRTVNKRKLTDEQYDQYKEASGKAIYNQLKLEMQQPEWKKMSTTEKKNIIKEVKKEEREAVRDELFPEPE